MNGILLKELSHLSPPLASRLPLLKRPGTGGLPWLLRAACTALENAALLHVAGNPENCLRICCITWS